MNSGAMDVHAPPSRPVVVDGASPYAWTPPPPLQERGGVLGLTQRAMSRGKRDASFRTLSARTATGSSRSPRRTTSLANMENTIPPPTLPPSLARRQPQKQLDRSNCWTCEGIPPTDAPNLGNRHERIAAAAKTTSREKIEI